MHFDVSKPQDLIHAVYSGGLQSTAIASLAPHVQEAYEEGDNVAAGILDGAARELTASALSVARRLGLLDEPCPFLLAGGVFKGVPWLVTELTRRITATGPGATVSRLEVEPAIGAVRFALAEARGGANVPVPLVRIAVFKTEREASVALARRVATDLAASPEIVLGLPTGRTPIHMYRELVKLHGRASPISPARRRSISTSSSGLRRLTGSYRSYMESHLFAHVNLPPVQIHF